MVRSFPLAPTQGRADLARLRRTSEAEIARTSPPELRDIKIESGGIAVRCS
jgi:hypothetical protein